MWREFNMCLAMTIDCKNKMNYECGRVKEDGMNFEVKNHPKSWKFSSKHNNCCKGHVEPTKVLQKGNAAIATVMETF